MKKYIIGLIVFYINISHMVFADDIKMVWQCQVSDFKTNAPIEAATVAGEFKDQQSGQISKANCTTDDRGQCDLSAFATGRGFFTSAEVEGSFTPSKLGYAKEYRHVFKKIDSTNMKALFYLTKNADSKYTLGYYEDLFKIKDDDLEVQASIDTSSAHKSSYQRSDISFLRAFINKQSGIPSYQVYVVLNYRSYGFRNFNVGTGAGPNGAISIPVEKIDQQVECSRKNDNEGKCDYQEAVIMKIDEAFLYSVAESFRSEAPTEWKFRLKAHSGDDKTMTLPHAEIAAFLNRVKLYSEKFKK